MTQIDSLRQNINALFLDSPQDARARTFRDAALLCLDSYEANGRMSALSEARACIVKLAALVAKAEEPVDDSVNVLKDLLTR